MPSYRDLYDFYYELKHMEGDLPDYIYHNAMNLLDGVFDRYEKDIKISKAEWKRVVNRLMDVAEQCEDEEQFHDLWSFAEELGGYVGVFGLNESKMTEYGPHGPSYRKPKERVPERILRLLNENGNRLSMDNGERFYTVVCLNEDEVEMSDMFKEQLQKQGIYNRRYMSAIVPKNVTDKIPMDYLPIFGCSSSYVTKWVHSSKLDCIEEDVRNRSMGLSRRLDINKIQESKLMESYVNTFVVFNTLSNTIVALCKSLEAAQQKAGSYNAYSNSSKFVGVPFTNIRHKDYTFSNDLLDKICDKFTESKMKESEETSRSFLADSIHRDPEFGYRLLGRMQSDCEYVLGACQSHGENKGALRHLWASGDPREQIACMRYIYNHLPEKPDWITEEDIDNYEKRLNELND